VKNGTPEPQKGWLVQRKPYKGVMDTMYSPKYYGIILTVYQSKKEVEVMFFVPDYRQDGGRAGTKKIIIPYDQIKVISVGAPKNYKEKFRDSGTI
tara:strand:+ start:465 stop:749 length:285 start_codon:yes stop_codon:yes gene_type:complete